MPQLGQHLKDPAQWQEFVQVYSPGGLLGQILLNARFMALDEQIYPQQLTLLVDHQMLGYDLKVMADRLSALFEALFKKQIAFHLEVCQTQAHDGLQATPQILRQQAKEDARQAFEAGVLQHEFIQEVGRLFGEEYRLSF